MNSWTQEAQDILARKKSDLEKCEKELQGIWDRYKSGEITYKEVAKLLHFKRTCEECIRNFEPLAAEQKYMNKRVGTDIIPYEVIREETEKIFVIREMTQKMSDDVKISLTASLARNGEFDNSLQKWELSSNPNGLEIVVRRNNNGKWYDRKINEYTLDKEPIKFYDFNI